MEDSEAYPGLERGSVGELALRHFRRQMGQYHSRVHGLARPDEVEYTHEMRVALRRLRAVKRLFGGALDGIPDDFDEDLKKWGRALGRVRDADVFMDYLRECEKDKGVQPDFLRKITRHLRDERRELRRHLLEELSSASEWRFDLLYWRLACAPQGDSDALRIGSKGRKPAVEKAPAILRKRLKSLRKFNKPLELCAPEELHALRVASKWARYAAEFLRDCYPDRLRALRMIMRRLQDRLGRVHDCDVFQRRAREYADRGLGGEEDAAGLQSLLDHIARDRQVALEKSIRAWKRYQKKRPQIMKSIQ
jgi:CHAD domain-containing protein